MNVIPDWYTADRIGREALKRDGMSYALFSYQQSRSGLTLYGVEVTLLDGSKREHRTQ